MTKHSQELKSCPFCGEEVYYNHHSASITCEKCLVGISRGTKEKAIAAWNTRQPDKRVAELEEIVAVEIQTISKNINTLVKAVGSRAIDSRSVVGDAILNMAPAIGKIKAVLEEEA